MIEFSEVLLMNFLTFTGMFIFCIVIPGPDFELVLRNSIMYSRRTGILTAIGTSFGLLFHATYTLIGMTLIIQETKYGESIVQILGILYCLYLGIKTFRSKSDASKQIVKIEEEAEHEHSSKDLTPFQAILRGFLRDALNPMPMLFFLASFSFILKDNTPLSLKLFFASEVWILAAIWFSTVAWFFSMHRIREGFTRKGTLFNRLSGSLLLLVALRISWAFIP